MEQIKDIFKQVRQAKGSLAFCKEEIINDTLYALADRVAHSHAIPLSIPIAAYAA